MRPLVPDGRPSEGCRRRGLMLAVWLSLWIQWSSAQGSGADLINTTVGQTVTLTAPVTENIASVSWHRGTTQTNEVKIFSYVVSTSQQYNGSQFSGRETGLPDGSMQIRDVRTSDTGNYTVKVTLSNGVPSSVTRQLRVYEPVTKPTVKYGSQYLMENQSSGAITCDTSGAAVTILWIFQNSQSLPPNFRLSDNNRILTILNVTRSNSGTYQCQAINPASASMSDPKTLPVAYGPEHVKISPSDPQLLQAGAKLSLTCSAVSVPGAQYQWLHNGTDLQTSGNTYTIGKVTSKEKGNYTCVAKNPIMGLSATAEVSIAVNEPVTKPTVKYGSQYLVENQSSGAIICETSSAATTILWIFNNSQVLPPHFRLSDNNRTLIIANVTRSSSGTYPCQALNPVSNSTSDPKTLPVAYGPENVMINPSEPQTLQAGAKLTLTCSAVSVPGAQYQWLLKGTKLQTSGNTYTIENVTAKDKGNYTCVAKNSVTGLSATAVFSINLKGTLPTSGWKVILGVTFGVFLGTSLIFTTGFLLYKRRRKTQNDENTHENPNLMQDRAARHVTMPKVPPEKPVTPSPEMDSTYMGLQPAPPEVYEQLIRK